MEEQLRPQEEHKLVTEATPGMGPPARGQTRVGLHSFPHMWSAAGIWGPSEGQTEAPSSLNSF